jgi:uncharacterized protein YndB with AHSA1/START domain
MVDIIHRIGIKAPVSEVYKTLATKEGVARWWTLETHGDSWPGGILEVVFNSPAGEKVGEMKMEVMASEPDKTVHWRFISGPQEWLGTDAIFELYQDGEYSIVLFGHKNWSQGGEFMAHCNTKWGTFMLSLKELLETGQGKPSPHDVKIDNWN